MWQIEKAIVVVAGAWGSSSCSGGNLLFFRSHWGWGGITGIAGICSVCCSCCCCPGTEASGAAFAGSSPGMTGSFYRAGNSVGELNPVLIQGLRQKLFQRGAIFGIGGFGRDDIVFRRSEGPLLLRCDGRRRGAQPQLFTSAWSDWKLYSRAASAACTAARSSSSASVR